MKKVIKGNPESNQPHKLKRKKARGINLRIKSFVPLYKLVIQNENVFAKALIAELQKRYLISTQDKAIPLSWAECLIYQKLLNENNIPNQIMRWKYSSKSSKD
jgi:hypothetical protein